MPPLSDKTLYLLSTTKKRLAALLLKIEEREISKIALDAAKARLKAGVLRAEHQKRAEEDIMSSMKSVYIIVVTLPSGNKYALGQFEGKFSLTPLTAGKFSGKCFAFDTMREANLHLKKQLAIAPDLKNMGEFEVEVALGEPT